MDNADDGIGNDDELVGTKECAEGSTASYQTDEIACRIISGDENFNTQGWSIVVDKKNAAGEQYCIQCPKKECPNGGTPIKNTDLNTDIAILSGMYCGAKKTDNITGWKLTISKEDYAGEEQCGFCEENPCKTGDKASEADCDDSEGWVFICNNTYSGDEKCGKCEPMGCGSENNPRGPCDKNGKCSVDKEVANCGTQVEGWDVVNAIDNDSNTTIKSGGKDCRYCQAKACPDPYFTPTETFSVDSNQCNEYTTLKAKGYVGAKYYSGDTQCKGCEYECADAYDPSKCTPDEDPDGGKTNPEKCNTIDYETAYTDIIHSYTCLVIPLATPTPASTNQTFIGKTIHI